MLTVLDIVKGYGNKHGTCYKCQCDCGNIVYYYLSELKRSRSCGCWRKSRDRIEEVLKSGKYVEGTAISLINNRTINSNNTSGFRGVSYDKSRGKWKAYIKVKRKQIFLGRYDTKEEAIKARLKAEDKYYKPIIERYLESEVKMGLILELFREIGYKYENMGAILTTDGMIIDYYINNSTYKSLEVEEVDEKLKVTILPEKIERTTDLEGMKEIFTILEKQGNYNGKTQEEIQEIKDKYKEGTIIELIKMYDFQAPTPKTKGTVDYIDDIGQIHVKWENGSNLALNEGVDEFKISSSINN